MVKLLELEELPIRVTARGEWLHGTTPLHPRVANLFARNIVPRADGSYLVKLGFAEQVLVVDDAAFFVRRVELKEDAGHLVAVELWLSDAAHERLDATTLMQSADNVLYARIRRHGLVVPCCFLGAPYYELAEHMRVEGKAASLTLSGKTFAIAAYDRAVVAA